jgi:hypothetical protein
MLPSLGVVGPEVSSADEADDPTSGLAAAISQEKINAMTGRTRLTRPNLISALEHKVTFLFQKRPAGEIARGTARPWRTNW